jgi:cytochrome c551/c552
MHRLVLASALLAACGSADDRPPTLDYIVENILAPSCAAAQCHSAFRQQVGDQFDTVAAARRSIVVNGLVHFPDEVADPSHSLLIRVLTVGATSVLDPSIGNVRMPYDSAIPDADVELIAAWIAGGAHGAQCLPNAQNRGCQVRTVMVLGQPQTEYAVVACNDSEAGAILQVCGPTQVCSSRNGNGTCTP